MEIIFLKTKQENKAKFSIYFHFKCKEAAKNTLIMSREFHNKIVKICIICLPSGLQFCLSSRNYKDQQPQGYNILILNNVRKKMIEELK